MQLFFIKLKVSPCLGNSHEISSKGAYAACWIKASDHLSAFAKATFLVERDEWHIDTVEIPPVAVTREMFIDRDVGLQNYDSASLRGFSVYYVAWSPEVDQETELPLSTLGKLDKAKYYKDRGSLLKKGYCLHPDSISCCNQIIKAHSIQKNQSLSSISIDNHVYQLSIKSSLEKDYSVCYEKEGINKASTFRGFCKKHDNNLFEAIDNYVLAPTEEQVFLYAYRSICRELFEKNKAVSLLNANLSSFTKDCAEKRLVNNLIEGTNYGLDNLTKIKDTYDLTLSQRTFSDMKFVVFKCNQKPNMAFSGLIYPDFDFLGNGLQDLSDTNKSLSLVTLCSAPMEGGWGYLLAWHQEKSAACDTFVASLAELINSGDSVEDALFRLIISGCENHAFSPLWWENLNSTHKEAIIQRVNEMVDPLTLVSSSYLQKGLEGIIDWSFDEVSTNLDPHI
ncbi:hypothetical protein [Vibrio europaeus]|uniref:hypothetical protein n=1 Tax=Vibrio europaeus TaxID=300876 RepID=UPI00233F126B|nr:hypothetical protein [Vibrio europaeus]MDC5856681.1 hypothetical protein [Vibrio europaeus]